MKFGKNLEQYSVPQWAPYNIDYDNVKQFIKEATSAEAVQAIKIPGQINEDELMEGFEKDLYQALSEEQERIELYCKTKHGETQRRLDHHSRLLDKLNSRGTKLSANKVQRLAKLEEGISRAGQDLQLLSRFIGANRLGFVKLLKKYKKWGGSARLIQKFRRERLDRSEFLSQGDPLASLLAQYTVLLEAVRATFDAKAPLNGSSHFNSVAQDLQHAFENSTQAEFDAILASSIPSDHGGRAVYWIHQDNLVQVHVLLQSVTNQRRLSANEIPSPPRKLSSSPLNTFGDDWSGSGMIVCGELENFKQTIPEAVSPASIFYTTSDKTVSLRLPEERLSLRRKEVALLLQTDYKLPHEPANIAFNKARKWLQMNNNVKPLAEVGYVRTRFAGFSNSKSQGLWATLDNDIVLARLETAPVRERFPHAILDIRWEGIPTPEIVRALDRQVIAERIPNFDLTIHAVAVTCLDSIKPEWLDILQHDLRKTTVNADGQRVPRVDSKHSSATTISDRPLSPFSGVQDQSSATSANEFSELSESLRRNRQGKGKQKLHVGTPLEEHAPEPRYWNEFDDGDENLLAQEAYTIEIYPDDQEDILVSMFSAFGRKLKAVTKKIGLSSKTKPETRPLLSPDVSTSSVDSEGMDTETVRPRGYSTFADPGPQIRSTPQERALVMRDRVLFYSTWIGYALAVAFLTMSLVIEAIGRKRYSVTARVFSVFGVLMSFLLASLGLTCALLRDGRMTFVERAIVILSFVLICVADSVLMISTWGSSG